MLSPQMFMSYFEERAWSGYFVHFYPISIPIPKYISRTQDKQYLHMLQINMPLKLIIRNLATQ